MITSYSETSNMWPSMWSSMLNTGTTGDAVWLVVSLVLALVGAFLVYFMFVKTDKKPVNKFLEWLKGFLDFQTMLIEAIAKISYIFVALFITLTSFALIGKSFVLFLITLVMGNVTTRVAYEGIMILISIWKNTKEINKKMK